MTEDQRVELLAAQPFFRGMAREHLELMAPWAREVRFGAGEYLFRQDRPAEDFYLLLEGRVALSVHSSRRGSVPIQTVAAGEPLGWSWLTPPFRWHFDGEALSPVRAMDFQAAGLRELMDGNFPLGYALLKRGLDIMARRLQATRLQLLDVYGDPP